MALSPENWQTIKALFHHARELASSERTAFLGENCPDPVVREEVDRLLREHNEAGDFLSSPLLASTSPKFQGRLTEGEILTNRFRVVRFIAAGGMGEVYEAEDLELR